MKWKGADKTSTGQTRLSTLLREWARCDESHSGPFFFFFFSPALLATKAEMNFDSGANWVVLQNAHTSRLSYKYNTPETRHLLLLICVLHERYTERCVCDSRCTFNTMYYKYFLQLLFILNIKKCFFWTQKNK